MQHNSSGMSGNGMNDETTQDADTEPTSAQLLDALAASKRQICTEQEKVSALSRINDGLRCELNEQASKFATIQHRAYFDQLTGLPNRSLLIDRFQLAMASAVRGHRQLALLFLDLNGFKKLNDEHGHSIGDKLLQRVAKRLTSSLRAIDTACRYGGDEFVVLLPDVDGLGGAIQVASKIDQNLSLPYHIDQKMHHIRVSIGVSLYPSDGDNFADLIKKADLAMYLAKTNGLPETIEVIAADSGYGLPSSGTKRSVAAVCGDQKSRNLRTARR